jgi:hypothetical protein
MKGGKMGLPNSAKICLALVAFILLSPSISWGDWSVLLFDDFDDGNYNGWSATHPVSGDPVTPPDVVSSPEGYSLRGVGSGYSQDPGLNVWLTYPLLISNAGELKIEMRAKSGPQWPNSAQVRLFNGGDYYSFVDYGESNQWAQFHTFINSQNYWYNHSINANVWHDFAWTRDADGWWSLSIDGQVEAPNFHQDNQLTSFEPIGIHVLRNQSEIEWVRISGGVSEPTEPPIADAGDDIIADANEAVILDASASYDPDGEIVLYTWKRLPDDVVIYSGKDPNCQTRALGRAEEVIELTVTDNYFATATDTVRIVSRATQDLEDRVAAMQSQIEELQQQIKELKALVDKIVSWPPIRQRLEKNPLISH